MLENVGLSVGAGSAVGGDEMNTPSPWSTMPPSRADSSRASKRSPDKAAFAETWLRVTWRAKDPENPVLPSSTMSQTGSKRWRRPQVRFHTSRSGVPSRVTDS